jgi:cell division protein FtsW
MRRINAILLCSVLILVLLGTVALFSSTTYRPGLDRVHLQICWIAVGSILGSICALADYSWLRRCHVPAYGLGIVLMLLVAALVPGIGVVRNGAARWLPFGQPSELAKLGLILFLADYGSRNQTRMNERYAGFLFPVAIAGLVVLAVFLEPDWGTAGLIAAVSLAMLAIAGSHMGYLLSAMIVGMELLAVLLLRNPLRLERLMAFLNPEAYRSGVAWQGWHSLLALGSGGWFGTLPGEGSHKNGFVPEQQTDFVLSLIGEELGFLGTATVVVLFVVILYCGARIAWKVSDPFGQLLASGITVLIGFQAFINVGVVTSSLPNKGIALPFVSYGGSNLVCMFVCLGLLLNVARHGPVLRNDPGEWRFRARQRPKAAGPVGSLLENSIQKNSLVGWQRFVRAAQPWRTSRFPTVALRSYQRPPRPTMLS